MKIEIESDDLRSLIGEGFHTAFRKATDSQASVIIWNAISDMPDDEWQGILDFVMSGIIRAEEVG